MHVNTDFLIIGAGMTGDMAAKGIRENDPKGSIRLIGAEQHPPYKRPHLSKKLWQGGAEEKIWPMPAEHVDLRTGRRIIALNLDAHTATDDGGDEYEWQKLLLTTGTHPREIPESEGVIYFRTLDDYRALRAIADQRRHVAVIGGGFIGSELAAGLVGVGARVTMLLSESGIGSRLFPKNLSDFVTGYYRERGVDVLTDQKVVVAEDGIVETAQGTTLEADAVVAGLGVIPNTELAETAGLEVADGIVVDEYGRVPGHEDVFAAGDVARFPVAALGTTLRIEHEDHANTHGRIVGANMGRRRDAVRPPAVLLLRPLRPRLRGRRAPRLAAQDGGGLAGAVAKGRRPLPRGRARARRPALERLGQGRRSARANPRRRGHACLAASCAREGAGPIREGRLTSCEARLETLLGGVIEPSAPRITTVPLSPAGVRKRQIERQVEVD
jgi:3-phenylpropionate/trans-cinnamate dioxygenase ferredoxin reductase component